MANYENGLKMSVEEIRNKIDLNNLNWQHETTTNCYAYALGLDVNEDDIRQDAYIPGTIGGSDYYLPGFIIFSYEDFLQNLFLDLAFLGIDVREINLDEHLPEDEWKIALCISPWRSSIDDYHFLRQSKSGIWYHKMGWKGLPRNYDCSGKIITNPAKCDLRNQEYKSCYSLKLKKKY